MGKMYEGNHPGISEGWEQIGKCDDGDGTEWTVYSRTQAHSAEWVTIKIAANGRAENKANYWLVRNIISGKIGFSRDYACMRDTRPDLHVKVETIIKGNRIGNIAINQDAI